MSDVRPDADATFVSISELSTEDAQGLYARFQQLSEFYFSQFGSRPKFFVRVPGRVNLIGEHVDYCGYPVLPMAIDQCILLAVGFDDSNTLLQLRNLEVEKFKNFECDLKTLSIELPKSGGPEWYKYYLCGIKGIYETLDDPTHPIGISVVLSGNIPPASGLSSSSALVSAAVLATAHVHRLPLDRKKLASIAASCERYIGTQGGGMDQAIAYLGRTGCAQFIEFHPSLNATPIELPPGACFVVANSLAEINKAASSDFNERVVECRLGAHIIGKNMQLEDYRDVARFALLQEKLQCDLSKMEQLASKYLPKNIYTREDVCAELCITENELEKDFLTPNTRKMTRFKIRQRTLHVIQESLRVRNFRAICEGAEIEDALLHCNGLNGVAKDKNSSENGGGCKTTNSIRLNILSLLMRQSHRSLKELYECSHPDLDQIIAISDAVGVSARLTGAGWGGCVVALCDSVEASTKYINELKEKYFLQLPQHIQEKHQHNNYANVIFATFPCNGAEIFTSTNLTA